MLRSSRLTSAVARLSSRPARRSARLVAPRPGLLPVVAALAFGCGGGGEPADGASVAARPAGSPEAAGAASPAVAAATESALSAAYAADAVDVALLEYVIGMPSRLPAGPTVFRLSNQGFEMHNLKLVDPASGDVVWETKEDVNTGEVRLVELDLSPGSYSVVCDVAGHDSRGMVTMLTVEAPPAP